MPRGQKRITSINLFAHAAQKLDHTHTHSSRVHNSPHSSARSDSSDGEIPSVLLLWYANFIYKQIYVEGTYPNYVLGGKFSFRELLNWVAL